MNSCDKERPDTVVVGLGNLLMTDEGVGVRVVQELARRLAGKAGVEFIDLGAGAGLRALHAIAGRRRAILVDCARMGETPGAMRRFTPDEVRSVKLGASSAHDADLLETIALAERLGECPAKVIIFGIEPACIEPGEGLSPALQERLEHYVDAVAREL